MRQFSLKRFYLIGFLLLMAFDTLAQVSFKLAANHAMPLLMGIPWMLRVFTTPWTYGAILGYIGAFFTWMTLLKHAPIGPAFAASHLEVISVLVLSVWLFGEHLTLLQLLGSGLIVAGIVCLARSENVAQAEHGEPDAADR
jgi:drug/metabolite transporter (DMT)-like permease